MNNRTTPYNVGTYGYCPRGKCVISFVDDQDNYMVRLIDSPYSCAHHYIGCANEDFTPAQQTYSMPATVDGPHGTQPPELDEEGDPDDIIPF